MPISIHKWNDQSEAQNSVPFLGDDEVQVWLGAVPANQTEISAYARLLDEPERLRAGRFQVAASRNEFVFGRAMLRQLLGGYLEMDPAQVAFDYGIKGKPRLAEGNEECGLRFNLAHSHSLVAIALARRREVGVDIEWTGRTVEWQMIAGQVFSPEELCELNSLPATRQPLAFFTGWTRKEAYLKATGEGLTDEISAIEISITPGRSPQWVRLPGATRALPLWDIQDIELPEGFAGAVVVER